MEPASSLLPGGAAGGAERKYEGGREQERMGLLSQRPDMQMAQRHPSQDVCGNSHSRSAALKPASPLPLSQPLLLT